MGLSIENQERLKLMNGCEVWSLDYEGCVGIVNDELWQDGKRIDKLDTDIKVAELWHEYVRGEFDGMLFI